MNIHRHVPMQAPLAAAAAVTDHTAPHGSDAFHRWFLDTQVPHAASAFGGGRSLLHQLSAPLDVITDLLPQTPNTPVGRAWCAAVHESVALTEADVVRPFDCVEYTTAEEKDALAAIEVYADRVEDTSPLLDDVAHTISQFAPTGRIELDALARERSRLTPEGFTLGSFDENFCEDHARWCYHIERPRLIQWEHLDAFMPDMEATLRNLLATLDAHLPEVAPSDGGAARGRVNDTRTAATS